VTLTQFRIRPGNPIFDQLVYAAKKTIISGELKPGQSFPSVRTLAAELKIHPNTVHKVVQHLIREGLLRVRPGIGTVVAELPEARAREKRRLLQQEVEALVVEAKRLGLDITEVIDAVEAQWARLEQPVEVGQHD
jgi:GntR family transcriptional regulator